MEAAVAWLHASPPGQRICAGGGHLSGNRSRSPMTSRPRTRKTAASVQEESSLLRWLKERHITEVECLVPDIIGNARGKNIPADKFSHDYGTRLPEGIFATTVTGDFQIG